MFDNKISNLTIFKPAGFVLAGEKKIKIKIIIIHNFAVEWLTTIDADRTKGGGRRTVNDTVTYDQ